MSQSHIPQFIFQTYLKDELVKLDKIYKEPKTRTIATAPLHFLIAYRKYFHSAHAALMQCWDKVSPKVGINPMSLDWHTLMTTMQSVSTYGLDLDFKGWDFSHDPFFVFLLALFYEILYEELDPDVTAEDQATRNYLYTKILCFLLLVGNILYKATGGIPSGYPGTTLDNSIVNLLITYYVWIKIMRMVNPNLANWASFVEDVLHAGYGDDQFLAISQYASKFFNGPVLQREFAKLGFTAQSSDKGSEIVPIKPLHECTFLSRRFVLLGSIWVGPLKRENLNKPTWFSSDRRSHYFWESPEERIKAIDIVQNVSLLYNAALDGRKVFNEFHPAAAKINRMCNLPPPLTYEDCLHRMLGFSKPTSICPGFKSYDFKEVLDMDWNHNMPENYRRVSNRTFYNFGPQYNFTGSAKSNPMPRNLKRIMQYVNEQLKTQYNSILVNIYPPGGCIPWHKDDERGLDMSQGVFGLTLKGDGRISFKSANQNFSYYLDPGIGYLMTEENLTQFSHRRDEHSIPTVTFTFRKLDTSEN